MLNELQPDIRKLLDLVRRMENFDASVAAAALAGKPIEVMESARAERRRMGTEAADLRIKWSI